MAMSITSHPLRLFFLLLSLCSTIIGAAFVGNKGDKFHECVAVFSVVFIIIGVLFNNRSVLFVLSSGLMYSVIPAFIGAADRNVGEDQDSSRYYYVERNGDKVNAGYILMSSGMLLSLVSLLSSKDLSNIRDTIRRSNIKGLIMVLFLFIINLIGCILIWIKTKQLRVGVLQLSIYFFFNSLLFIYFYLNRGAYYYSAIGYFIFTYYAVVSLVYAIISNNSIDRSSMYVNYSDPDSNNNQSRNQLIAGFSLIFAAHILFIPVLAHMANNNNNNNDNNNNSNNNRGSINNNNASVEGQARVEQFRSGPKHIFRLILLFLCLIITIIGCILLKDENDELIVDILPVISVLLLIGTLFINDNNNNNNQYSIALYSSAFSLLILCLPHHIYDRSYHTNHPQSRFLSGKKLDAGILLLIIGASLAFFIRVLTKDYINRTNNNILSGSKIEKGAIILGLFGELIGFIGSILLFIVAGYLPDDYTLPFWTIPVVILLIFAFCILLFSTSIYYRLLFIAVASFLIIRIIDGVQFNNIHYTKQDELRQVGLSLLSVAIGLLQIAFCILLWPLKSELSSPLSESAQEGLSMTTVTESSAPEGISSNV